MDLPRLPLRTPNLPSPEPRVPSPDEKTLLELRYARMTNQITHERAADVVRAVEDAGIVAVIRIKDPSKLRAVVDAIAEGGIRALEVTMTVPGAVELIASSRRRCRRASCSAPARSSTPTPCARVVDAGARFVVSPVFRRSVIEACHARDVAAMPGCFTPTEILDAWDAGADIVKVFPATALGPAYLKDVRAPLPQVKLMPTGGVTRRQRRRLDSRRRGRGRRRHGAARRQGHRRRPLRRAAHATRERIDRQRPRRAEDKPDAESRDVRRDHAAAQPAGVRAPAPVAGAGAPRSAAAKPTSPSAWRSSASRATTSRALPKNADRRRRDPRAARRRRAHRPASCAAAIASASTSPKPAPASAPPPSSTTAPIRRSARWSPTRWTGRR